MVKANAWVEISRSALIHNIRQFKKIIGPRVRLLVAVKANAYGHGLVLISGLVEKNGVDFLGVNSLEEAEILRKNKVKLPLLILGYVRLNELQRLQKLSNVSLTVYNKETIRRLGLLNKTVKVHLKLETGTARQGILPENLLDFVRYIRRRQNLVIEGLYTHYANIEDTLNHDFAFKQLSLFKQSAKLLSDHHIHIPLLHTACSAAAILYQQTYFDMVRSGISVYGLWSSNETKLVAARQRKSLTLKPVLSWKTVVAQIKPVKKGQPVGYGCSERVYRDSQIAVIPVGYWDGFDRGMGSLGNVIVRGQRAKIIGRICMNMFMADVTDIAGVEIEDEVVLIGQQGREEITANEFAQKLQTINYEVVTRINPCLPRVAVK
ncbi:MAG: Alanine racemase [Parcubacteria group bacterium GW2011_GWA2_43_17]|nr:MAG: Alanine racemase [Parcubacteria group bacterium GW2011_GWA2_43_17]KKT94506.1 MAG: Alanine racemase [Parcubacteria group bacterium GW2011_GWF2_45_11]KKT98132.1 MAG: Alanine racemase [Parcubacteria group bacterium GW2011_GWC2_45_15]OGY92326.1 MAG: alanine racemase [Candidatus Komeilibacteria bacterium RIFOXYA2_FULL_45_9]OGY95004.1 MAG: alanine racemase [Candidatus Komeilibacteria bacterium RIFOXYC2_FULL_45_12]HAH04489.1 alanine racemase [Candidatus Komeilibacteria bacterium]